MQVTKVSDRITHAVIGGKPMESFKIDDSPEFFHVLSSALYSDKMLAVVRETLCNAWDAHIEAGCTDKAVRVSLDRNKLVIRDFGHGIHPEQIGPIYCTYGRSTKKDNGAVTGGFGLGCKAPFAYVDHFGVDSWHAGVKTMYRMSLSSAMVGGKPSVTPLVSVPMEDGEASGLAVTIELKDPDDYHRFYSLICEIVRFGDMKVELNGELLPTIDFTSATNGYVLIRTDVLQTTRGSRIRIRYGNVVYPLDNHEAYTKPFGWVLKYLGQVAPTKSYYDNENNYWTLILQAEPDSLSITPSRESLSMTDSTTTTVKRLLEDFLERTKGQFENACLTEAMESLDETILVGTPADLLALRQFRLLSRQVEASDSELRFCRSVGEVARTWLSRRYPAHNSFPERDRQLRIEKLIESGWLDRGLLQSYARLDPSRVGRQLRAKLRHRFDSSMAVEYAKWFQRRLVWPLIKGMDGKKLRPRELMVFSQNNFSPAMQCSPGQFNYDELLPFTRRVIILANRRDQVTDEAPSERLFREWFGSPQNSFVYFVPRVGNRAELAREYFGSLDGWHLVDLTEEPLVIERKPKVRDPNAPPRVVKPKGYPLLSSALIHDKTRVSGLALYAEKAARSEQPEFVLVMGRRDSDWTEFAGFGAEATLAICRLFGHRGVVVPNSKGADKLQAAGVKEFKAFVVEALIELFETDPVIADAYRFHWKHRRINLMSHPFDEFTRIVLKDNELRQALGVPGLPKQSALDALTIWNSYQYYTQKNNLEFAPIRKKIEAWSENKELEQLVRSIERCEILRLFDYLKLGQMLRNPKTEADTRKLFLAAVKG